MNSRHACYEHNCIYRAQVCWIPTDEYVLFDHTRDVRAITWILLYNIKLALALIFIVVMHFFDTHTEPHSNYAAVVRTENGMEVHM